MSEYIPIGPEYGEQFRIEDEESDAQLHRLENESPEELRKIIQDSKQSLAARGNALLLLLMRKDQEVFRILPELFDDRDLGHLAIKGCRADDPKTAARLQTILVSGKPSRKAEAAMRLAKAEDDLLRPVLLDWFNGADQGLRNFAVACLKELDQDAALVLFRQHWDSGVETDTNEHRLVLASTLLQMDDARGLPLLKYVAEQANGAWASFAAFETLRRDPELGCELLLNIIDTGDNEAKQSVVSQVWNFERNPNAFNAQGIHEARRWVELQLKEHRAGREVGLPSWVAR